MSKTEKLGMNPSTASHRLVKDILFNFVRNSGYKCFRCGGNLTRDTFSIEHIESWLDSDNPKEKYFDLDNITFSHLSCNSRAGGKVGGSYKKYKDDESRIRASRESKTKHRKAVCKETGLSNRQLQYIRTGK